MSHYYDLIYRQIIKKLQSISTRPRSETDTNYINYSCAVITRERHGNTEYEVVELGSIICASNQIKERTEFITIQVDTNKLSNSYYLLEYADRLTYQLCNAILKE